VDVWMFCTSGAPVYLVYLLVGVCLPLVVLHVFSRMFIFNTVSGGVNVH